MFIEKPSEETNNQTFTEKDNENTHYNKNYSTRNNYNNRNYRYNNNYNNEGGYGYYDNSQPQSNYYNNGRRNYNNYNNSKNYYNYETENPEIPGNNKAEKEVVSVAESNYNNYNYNKNSNYNNNNNYNNSYKYANKINYKTYQQESAVSENPQQKYSNWENYEVNDNESEGEATNNNNNHYNKGRTYYNNNNRNSYDDNNNNYRKKSYQATAVAAEGREGEANDNANYERKPAASRKNQTEEKKEDLLDIPENAVSLAEYKRKNLLNKEKLNQEAYVDTSKNAFGNSATAANNNNNNKNAKKEKALKLNNKRDNELEENLNDLISKKIIQSTQQRESNYGYESNRNRDDFRTGNDRRRNDFEGERREYNVVAASENSNRNYNHRNYDNIDSNNDYYYNNNNHNQEGNFGEQYARDNYTSGSRRGRGGNYNGNRNPLRSVNILFLIILIF